MKVYWKNNFIVPSIIIFYNNIEIEMKLSKIILVVLSIFSSLIVSSCCSCKNVATDKNVVKGYITVVGNEPFAKLAIKTDDDKIYILSCNKELENELYKQQGNYYSITFKESKIEMDIPVITVETAAPINKESK